jgi:CheY-like chemotaxis protein
MRLTYKILWFEDNDEFYDSLNQDEIRNHLGSKGFETMFIRKKGEEPLEEIIREAQRSDLIIMDFALEGPEQGDDLIRQIRDGNINTEVVFYSAAAVSSLREQVFKKELDGVYCRGRDEITSDVIPIIDSTIRKILDLENSRGLVMSELGELDLLMNEIIVTVHDSSEERQAFIKGKMKTRLAEQVKTSSQRLERIDGLGCADLVETALDSSKRLDTMVSICKKLNLDAYRERLNEYKKTVLFPRNCLAHGVPEEIPDGGYIFRHGDNEFSFTEESNIELRNSLRSFKGCLHELRAEILAICAS